jgi:tripeptidyl-peptidase I
VFTFTNALKQSFLEKYRADISSSTTFTTVEIDGGKNPQTLDDAGTEADLDVEYTIGLATGVPVSFLSVGDDYQDGDLDGFLDTVNYVFVFNSR